MTHYLSSQQQLAVRSTSGTTNSLTQTVWRAYQQQIKLSLLLLAFSCFGAKLEINFPLSVNRVANEGRFACSIAVCHDCTASDCGRVWLGNCWKRLQATGARSSGTFQLDDQSSSKWWCFLEFSQFENFQLPDLLGDLFKESLSWLNPSSFSIDNHEAKSV